jgi:hypothetical protein
MTSNTFRVSEAKLYFRVSNTRSCKCQNSSSQESRSCEMRNAEIPKQVHQQRLNFGVSDTGIWRSQESRLFITGVRKLEMQNAKILKQAHQQRLHFRVSDTGSWRSQELRLFITRVLKLRNVKLRNAERDYCESRKLERKNSKIPSTVHLSGLCEPSNHFGDFVIINFIILESQ